MLEIDENKLEHIRDYIVTNLFRNAEFMYDEVVEDLEVAEIICDLYEYLHILIKKEPYSYMFHWANKCGSWVETGEFDKYIEEIMKEKEIEEMKVEKIVCDRCGTKIINPIKRKLFLSALGSEGGLDLCNSCYDELSTWFSNKHTHITEREDRK